LKADPIHGVAAAMRTKRLMCKYSPPRQLPAFLCLKRITSEGVGHLQHSGKTDSENEESEDEEESEE
jgi:hypothetical protein